MPIHGPGGAAICEVPRADETAHARRETTDTVVLGRGYGELGHQSQMRI